jgi:hypothetical protein
MKAAKWLIVIGAGLGSGLALAQETAATSPWQFQAYAKSYALGGYISYLNEAYFQSINAFRGNLQVHPIDWFQAEAAYELQPVLQAGAIRNSLGLSSSLPRTEGGTYRVVDFDAKIYENNSREFVLFHNVDRLNAQFKLPLGDLTLGRQAITFGTANSISPTDVLLPYSFQQVSIEYRIGVDALRAQIPIGEMAELDFGAVVGQSGWLDRSAVFARTTFALLKGQWALLGMRYSGAWLAGGGVEWNIGDLGWNTDLAYTFAPEGERSYFRLTTGLSYQFGNGLVWTSDYHYNGSGGANAGEYAGVLTSFAFQRGGVFLFGRHYWINGVSYPVHALVSIRGQVLLNILDPSAFVVGGAEWNAWENGYLDFGIFVPVGQEILNASIRSEFGAYPVTSYVAVRHYF